MTDSERETAIAEIVGPCPGCESPPHRSYTVEQQEAIIALDAEIGRDAPELNATIRRLDSWCPICIRQHEQATGKEARRNKIDVLTRRTYRQELIPASGKLMKFSCSNKEVEPPNEEIFDRFREELPIKKNLWIHGDPGTSKTFLARCILNAYLADYKTAGELASSRINEIGRGFHADRDVKPFAKLNILLIEDIDKPSWHRDGLSALWNLIDKRATEGTRIIVTSNQEPQVISTRMRQVSSQNTTLVTSMFERLMPMERIHTTGASARREA